MGFQFQLVYFFIFRFWFGVLIFGCYFGNCGFWVVFFIYLFIYFYVGWSKPLDDEIFSLFKPISCMECLCSREIIPLLIYFYELKVRWVLSLFVQRMSEFWGHSTLTCQLDMSYRERNNHRKVNQQFIINFFHIWCPINYFAK